jgi:L-ascorbate metabolism protein UlaG (beta-lactamase superfamily)
MDIIWYGHSCFRLRDRDATVVTDPFDKTLGYDLPRVRADIVTVSHGHPHHNHTKTVKGEFKLVDGPGEYEIKSVFIKGIATYSSRSKGKGQEDRDGDECNVVFVFEFDGLTICHLGDLAQVPTQTQVEALSNVDVLLVPVGGNTSLNAAQGAEIISLVEPHVVIPMQYKTNATSLKLDGVEKFLKEMGTPRIEPVDTLKVTKSSLSQETQVVVLNYK